MKINLSKELKQEAEATRAAIAAALERYLANTTTLPALEQDERRLATDIAQLEQGTDYGESAMGELTRKQQALTILRRRISAVRDAAAPIIRELAQTLEPMPSLMHRAHSPLVESERKRIAALLRPFYGDDQGAATASGRTDYIASLRFFMGRSWGNWPADDALKALAILDRLLTGESGWEFDPHSK